jgi:DNA-binding response OmpR family regulator
MQLCPASARKSSARKHLVDKVTVFLFEPDPARLAHFESCLSRETNLVLIRGHEILFAPRAPTLLVSPDVLLLDADCAPVLDVRLWARIHLMLPATHIIALTDGTDNRVLEAVLATGLTGLFRPDCEQAVLVQAIYQAARGIISFDQALIEHAKKVVLDPPDENQLRFGGLTIDLLLQKVTRWGRHIHLTPLEFAVLAYLARQQGRSVSLVELLAHVWFATPDDGGTLAQVHNCIKRLRQKIEPDPQHPRYLLSERGWGYWLQDPTLPQRAVSPADTEPSCDLPFETTL